MKPACDPQADKDNEVITMNKAFGAVALLLAMAAEPALAGTAQEI